MAALAKRRTSSAGVPAARTLPSRMAITLSHRASARTSSWVTSRTVVPTSRSWSTAAHAITSRGGVQARGEPAENDQPRGVEQRQHQEQPLAFAAAHRPERVPAPVRQPESFQERIAVGCGGAGPGLGEQGDGLTDPHPVGQGRTLQLAAHRYLLRLLRQRTRLFTFLTPPWLIFNLKFSNFKISSLKTVTDH